MGILGEVYRNASPKRICQVDLGIYSHKHNPLGATRAEGLQRMALDIATTLYRMMASMEGARIPPDLLVTLQVAYRREAQDAIRKYHMDSLANGLLYDRHGEESVVEALEPILRDAGHLFAQQPSRDQLGEWLRALSADPEAPARLHGQRTLPVKGRDALLEAALQDGRR